MTGGVITLPEPSQTVLATHVPDLQIDLWEGDGRDILADGGDSFEVWVVGGGDGLVYREGFYVLEEGCFTSIVEA